jgi:hypothetical protein
MVADAGYSLACGASTGPATFGVEPYEIRRIAIRNTTSIIGFEMRLLTPFQSYEWIRWKAIYAFSGLNGANLGNGESTLKKKRIHWPWSETH